MGQSSSNNAYCGIEYIEKVRLFVKNHSKNCNYPECIHKEKSHYHGSGNSVGFSEYGKGFCKSCGNQFDLFDLSGNCKYARFTNKDLDHVCLREINHYFKDFDYDNSRRNSLDMKLILRHCCDSCSEKQYKISMDFKAFVKSNGRNYVFVENLKVYETEIISRKILLTKFILHGQQHGLSIFHTINWIQRNDLGVYIPDKLRMCRSCGRKFLDLSFLKTYADADKYQRIFDYLKNNIEIQNVASSVEQLHICNLVQ
jgi:hypothetical protein